MKNFIVFLVVILFFLSPSISLGSNLVDLLKDPQIEGGTFIVTSGGFHRDEEKRTFSGDYNKIFDTVLSALGEIGNPIVMMNKESGIISTDYVERTKPALTTTWKWKDKYYIRLKRLSGNQVGVGIRRYLEMEGMIAEGGHYIRHYYVQKSNGALENWIFEQIQKAAGYQAGSTYGIVAARQRDISFKLKGNLLKSQPLLISKVQASSIKIIAISYFGEDVKRRGGQADLRLYDTHIKNITNELKKSSRFAIITPIGFIKKRDELQLSPYISLLTERENIDLVKKIGRALECDAILSFGARNKKIDLNDAEQQTRTTGMIEMPITYVLNLSSSQTGKTIWQQEQEVIMSAGKMGKETIENIPQDELTKLLLPGIKPLIDNLLHTF